MDRIIDYVRWYSDIPLTVLPFNEVDNLVLCGLSYWKFPNLNWRRGKHTLRECFEQLHGEPVEMMTTDTDESMPEFVRYAALSRRFGDLYVSDYVDEFFPEIPSSSPPSPSIWTGRPVISPFAARTAPSPAGRRIL